VRDRVGHIAATVMAAALLGLSGAAIVLRVRALPLGEWDGWLFWNLKARWLFAAPDHWRVLFDADMPHPDYPLQLPLLIARLWAYAGEPLALIPQVVSGGAAWLSVLLMLLGVTALRGVWIGLAAGGTLAATDYLARQSGWQYADLPLAWFILAAAITGCLCLERKLSRARAAALVGVLVMLAAWTKNEGLVFAALLLPAFALLSLDASKIKPAARQWLWLLGGALPVGVSLLVLKLWLAQRGTDLFVNQTAQEAWALLGDPARHAQVWRASVGVVRESGTPWLIVAWLIAVVVGFRPGGTDTTGVWRSAALLAVVLLGQCLAYHVAYVTTHAPLNWHLRTSQTRLFLHVWPLALLLLALLCTPPRSRVAPVTTGTPANDH